jgi:hypothetical protein
MRFRKLRIAWSVTCCVLCLGQIVRWVRSYRQQERLTRITSDGFINTIVWAKGTLAIVRSDVEGGEVVGWYYFAFPLAGTPQVFVFESDQSHTAVAVPIWFLSVFLLALSLAPWLHWLPRRFSLRTLLIATTLVAVMLGLAVWASS